jgi:phytochrome-interacting factor 4
LSLLLFACSGEDDDGLMWCNGHVVMQAQAPRKPPRPDDKAAAHDDDEAAAAQSWFQYPVEERADLFSELFGEAQAAVGGARGEAARQSIRMMPPPPPPPRPAQAPREEKACPGDGATATATETDGSGSSVLTIVSNLCGSNGNHVQATAPGDVARARNVLMVTSSSTTRSRSCTTKSEQPGPGPGAARRSGKRKHNDATDAEVRTYMVHCRIAPPVPARPLPGPPSFRSAASASTSPIDDTEGHVYGRECRTWGWSASRRRG